MFWKKKIEEIKKAKKVSRLRINYNDGSYDSWCGPLINGKFIETFRNFYKWYAYRPQSKMHFFKYNGGVLSVNRERVKNIRIYVDDE